MVTRARVPFESLFDSRDTFDQLFARATGGSASSFTSTGAAHLSLNVYETSDALHVEALLPGIGREDVRVDIDRGVLTIAATRHGAGPGAQNWYMSEFGAGEFTRSIGLPYPIDQDRVAAHFADGVLRLTLPEAESAKPRQIRIGGEQSRLGSGQATS